MSVKQTTSAAPTKPKMWVVKKGKDGPETKAQTGSITDIIRRTCDCACQNCKDIYGSYIDAQAMVKILQDELADCDKLRQNFILEVSEMERRQMVLLQEKEDRTNTLESKVESLSKALENERQLRMEDVYRMEFQKKEAARTEEELRDVRKQWVEALAALPNTQNENKLLKMQLELQRGTIEKMNAELGSYNYELATLEDQNTRLRLRLSEADTKLGKALRANASVSKAASSTEHLPALKSTLRSSSTCSSARPLLLPSRSAMISDTSVTSFVAQVARQSTAKQLRCSYS
jgi:chromosome segregation ATPase